MDETGDTVTESYGSTCRYRTTTPIACGSFGTVFKAVIVDRGDFKGETIVAVKTVHVFHDISGNAEKCTQLQQKLKALLDIEHPNLVRYHRLSFISHGSVFSEYRLVMDYYSDGDLKRLLQYFKVQHFLFGDEAIIGYAAQLADGLAFLHENNIIHGDLKPANVLVKRMENVPHILRIGDFDDSVRMRRNATTARDISNLRGTFRYMSPEMLRKYYAYLSEEMIGRKTDVWSLGCIVLDLMSAGNHKNYLRNESSGEKLESDQGKMFDTRFAELVADGWVPHVPDTTARFLASCLQKCLCINNGARISAVDLFTMLRNKHSVKSLTINSDVPPAVLVSNVPIFQEMIMNRATSVTGNHALEGFNDGIFFFHLYGLWGQTRMQWMDSAFTIQPVNLPEALTDLEYLSLFCFADSEAIMHIRDDSEKVIKIIAWNIRRKSWRIICRRPISEFYPSSAVVVGNEIYYLVCNSETPFQQINHKNGVVTILPDPQVDCSIRARWGSIFRYGSQIICCADFRDQVEWWVKSFDTQTNQWHDVCGMPDSRTDHALILLDEFIYLLGGQIDVDSDLGPKPQVISTCFRYNLKDGGEWEKIADLNTPRVDHGAFSLKGCIYVYGGNSNSNEKNKRSSDAEVRTMEVYDSERNFWTEVQYKDNDSRSPELDRLQPICVSVESQTQ